MGTIPATRLPRSPSRLPSVIIGSSFVSMFPTWTTITITTPEPANMRQASDGEALDIILHFG